MINDRIREARSIANMTQDALAKRLKLTKSTISQWESGMTTPNGKNLINLAEALNVSPEWLLTGGTPTPKELTSNARVEGGFSVWDSATPLEDDEVEIPFYQEIELSAGNGTYVDLNRSGGKLRFARSTLRKAGVDAGCAACVSIHGNSMEPVLPDGAVVGVDTSKKSIKDGQMYAIDHEGLLRVKLVYRLPGGIRIRSFNRDEYADEEYFQQDANKIRVIGQVFWYSVLL
ncbi:helix-turn-helix transcriptional regulator [Salmonella enterica subsp. diarizonae]|uniref:Helix-turn-helix transcriptional regulator n=1 Tax=Salmonella enterica subsp. enterica serovar Panama TaxID=29472 RepID=A0A5U8J761_SALET|nr:helix-turn-helix transcriptional regulator [Salmonella enterica]EBR7995731.1 helix-turn-helix transcriptional regulator [Salmonella enterica subsp. enterica serovar Panama]EDU8161093.1 helix-turn-helix transcriptional regulator [Salmonella enterica subsp. diarizonae]ASD87965.1 XRE family transcriptional regulator [Salmonella enterica subsp. enterica serovar India str. SA20085604]EBR8433139.1 helix-turn-helix transcriptional regulator [Salmonella enterica subsp. enterica serovar Panama]EBW94